MHRVWLQVSELLSASGLPTPSLAALAAQVSELLSAFLHGDEGGAAGGGGGGEPPPRWAESTATLLQLAISRREIALDGGAVRALVAQARVGRMACIYTIYTYIIYLHPHPSTAWSGRAG